MSFRVLVTDGMDAGAMEQLRKDGYEVVEQFYEPDQLGEALRDFDAVIIRSATKIKEPQIDAAKDSRLKLELGLCKGKKLHDKRDSEAERQSKRDIDRMMKEKNYA